MAMLDNQMVIILDVWTNNMTMIPPMYGKTDEEPVEGVIFRHP